MVCNFSFGHNDLKLLRFACLSMFEFHFLESNTKMRH